MVQLRSLFARVFLATVLLLALSGTAADASSGVIGPATFPVDPPYGLVGSP